MKRYALALVVVVGILGAPAGLVGLAGATERHHNSHGHYLDRHHFRHHHRGHHYWNDHHWNHHRHWHPHPVPDATPVWRPGYWHWSGWTWVWVPGHWAW